MDLFFKLKGVAVNINDVSVRLAGLLAAKSRSIFDCFCLSFNSSFVGVQLVVRATG